MEPLQKAESLFRPWELEVKLRNEQLEAENSEMGNELNSLHKERCRLEEVPKTIPVARNHYSNKRSVRRSSDSEVDTSPMKKPRYESPSQNPRTKSLPSHLHNYGVPMERMPCVRTSVGSFNPRCSLPSSLFTDPRHQSRIHRVTSAPESLPTTSPLVDTSGPPESARRKRPKDKLCPKCPNTFSNQAQLDAHLRGHFNVRNYACDYVVDGDSKKKCDKRFVRKEELTRHQRTHTGEKPHLCRMCGKGFGRKDHLQKHEKTHEKTGPPQQFPFPGHHPPGFMLHPPGMPPYPLFPLHHHELPPRMPPPGYMLNLLAYPQLLPLGIGGDSLLQSVSAGFPSRAVRTPKTDPELAKI